MKKMLIWLVCMLCSCSTSNEDMVGENEPKIMNQNIILALWDSLTAGYGVDETENYPTQLQQKLSDIWYEYKVVNAWVSGDTTANVLSRAELYLEQKPEIVLLVVGWNDGLRWLSPQEMKNNILQIIDTFSWSTVVLGGMDLPENLWEAYRTQFKQVYQDIANERQNIYFIPFFLEWVWGVDEYNISDRIHPNQKWYEIIVNNLVLFLEKNNILKK